MKKKIKQIIHHPRMRDIRNIALLSATTIIAMQAITNADLIKLMASNWLFGIQQTFSPQETLNLSTVTTHKHPTLSTDSINKLLASASNNTKKADIVPSMEAILSQKSNTYEFTYNTLPPINKVTIDSLGIDAPIVSVFFQKDEDAMMGDFDEQLKSGVAIYPGTALPGKKGHSLIFGHSSQERWKDNKYNTIFSMIGDLKSGDTFTVTWGGKLLTYQVKEQQVVTPNKVIDIYNTRNDEGANRLSLVTCRPRGTDHKRMVVTSELIDSNTNTENLLAYNTP